MVILYTCYYIVILHYIDYTVLPSGAPSKPIKMCVLRIIKMGTIFRKVKLSINDLQTDAVG